MRHLLSLGLITVLIAGSAAHAVPLYPGGLVKKLSVSVDHIPLTQGKSNLSQVTLELGDQLKQSVSMPQANVHFDYPIDTLKQALGDGTHALSQAKLTAEYRDSAGKVTQTQVWSQTGPNQLVPISPATFHISALGFVIPSKLAFDVRS